MTSTPGKYDKLAAALQEGYASDAAMVLIVGGTEGFGCSIKAKEGIDANIPGTLRSIADQIERDLVMKRTLDLPRNGEK